MFSILCLILGTLTSADAPAGLGPGPRIPFGGTDFKQYYATSRLILNGKNPYDHQAVGSLQRALGAKGPTQVPYGPPTCLLPFIPLGWLDFPTAISVQLILNTTLIIVSGFLWSLLLFPKSSKLPLAAGILVLGWLPGFLLLGLGHVTTWTLFGFTAWCSCMNRRRPVCAGIALALTIIKPHLALGPILFALVAGFRHRQWRMLLAFCVAIMLAVMATIVIRPTIWSEYLESLPHSNPTQWYNATLDGWARHQLDVIGMRREAEKYGLDRSKLYETEPPEEIKERYGNRFRPVSLGIGLVMLGWVITLAWRREHDPGQLALVLPLSMCATPYAFSYDYVLLIPALVLAMGSLVQGRNLVSLVVILGWVILDAFYLNAKRQEYFHESNYFIIPWSILGLTLLLLNSGRALPGQSGEK